MSRTVESRVSQVITWVYFPVYILFVGTSVHLFAIVMKEYLSRTPMTAIMAALVLVAMYGARFGLESVARVVIINSTTRLFD